MIEVVSNNHRELAVDVVELVLVPAVAFSQVFLIDSFGSMGIWG